MRACLHWTIHVDMVQADVPFVIIGVVDFRRLLILQGGFPIRFGVRRLCHQTRVTLDARKISWNLVIIVQR